MLNKLGVIVFMLDMTVNFLAKGGTVITRKVDLKATQEYYAQSLKVADTWLGPLSMAIPTRPILLGYY